MTKPLRSLKFLNNVRWCSYFGVSPFSFSQCLASFLTMSLGMGHTCTVCVPGMCIRTSFLIKVELEVLSYRQTDTVISVYMVRYRYIINNQVKTG